MTKVKAVVLMDEETFLKVSEIKNKLDLPNISQTINKILTDVLKD